MGRNRRIEKYSSSTDETIELGLYLSKIARPNTIFCLFGDLGAGKTTLIKGIVSGVTGILPHAVSSPTFLYLNQYTPEDPKKSVVYHFDLYRLKDPEEFFSSGFDEFLSAGGVACIEWSERIASHLQAETIHVHMSAIGEERRKIVIGSDEESLI